ncbi:MAG: hypothetical protein IPI07_19605 [Flavobacteriales bacterium]|nr:hypothetical protein [Flavobacteriales bacterium]
MVTAHRSGGTNALQRSHYCVPNIGGRVPRTAKATRSATSSLRYCSAWATRAVSRNGEATGVSAGVYLYNGQLTSGILGEAFHIPYKDLDILLAAFRS